MFSKHLDTSEISPILVLQT